MITEDYVSLETAKLLKEKGFNEECIGYYVDYEPNDVKYSFMGETNSTWEPRCYSAPTLQMVMKWLREVHKLCISITPQVTDDDGDGGCLWQFAITSHLEPLSISLELYEQYEEACEAAIKYCLENLI